MLDLDLFLVENVVEKVENASGLLHAHSTILRTTYRWALFVSIILLPEKLQRSRERGGGRLAYYKTGLYIVLYSMGFFLFILMFFFFFVFFFFVFFFFFFFWGGGGGGVGFFFCFVFLFFFFCLLRFCPFVSCLFCLL